VPSRQPESANKEEFVSSLARGLAVIRAFGPDRPQMALSEVAIATDLSPAVSCSPNCSGSQPFHDRSGKADRRSTDNHSFE
jgi:hypothetical protein